MKITALHFGMPNYDTLLDSALFVVTETLRELGEVDVETERIAFAGIPFYDGMPCKAIENISQSIASSDGIIVAAPSALGAPNALCKAFFENIADPAYSQLLMSKNCFVLSVSREGEGERRTVEDIADLLCRIGGYDAVRLAIGADSAALIDTDEKVREIIERHAEDYYRILRQNRKFFVPSSAGWIQTKTINAHLDADKAVKANNSKFDISPDEYEMLLARERQKQTAAELLERRSAEKIVQASSENEQDINEIAQFFVEKYAKSDLIGQSASPAIGGNTPQFSPQFSNVAPRTKTVKQMTFSLPHFFNPQLSAGLNAVVQINISGAETFNCYVNISNIDCEICEGSAEKSDIMIISEAKVWSEVLKGKYTAQKAFMIGQLKVRGNFMLLTKFDQLFTLEMK